MGIVSGSGTRSLDSVSRDPVPDLETQSLEVQYHVPSQPYEDCLGVGEYIGSYYTAVISGLFSQYFDEIFHSATTQSFSCCFKLFIQNKSETTVFSVYYLNSLCMGYFFPCMNYVFTHCIFIIAFS